MIINKQERNVTGNSMLSVIPIAGIFFKFLLFNAIWCYYTTFTPFSCWESYATAFVATLLLSLPYILIRHIAAGILVMAMLDIWMVANLMYYRTYFSAIPLSSYMLAGNLADFLPSVTTSLRWCDWLFPISTVVTVFLTFRICCRQKITFRFSRRIYVVLLISSCALLSINLSARGGLIAIYRTFKSSAHQHASGPPLYTLFGTLYFDYAEEFPELTEEQEREIHTWLSGRPSLVPVPEIEYRDNCILILAESLESWVLNLTVEN